MVALEPLEVIILLLLITSITFLELLARFVIGNDVTYLRPYARWRWYDMS